jgi:hypothetical protein
MKLSATCRGRLETSKLDTKKSGSRHKEQCYLIMPQQSQISVDGLSLPPEFFVGSIARFVGLDLDQTLPGKSLTDFLSLPLLSFPPPQRMDVTSLFRKDFLNLDPYAPVKPLEVLAEEIGLPVAALVKLDANENLYGPIPEVGVEVTF